MKAELAARDGDLRLCLLLGIAAWFLFLDHVPHNVVGQLTMRNFGFSGATDLFVFVGGYTAAILYGRMMLERGFVVTATRIFKRLWQLYAAYIVLFVIYINLIGYVARQSAAPTLWRCTYTLDSRSRARTQRRPAAGSMIWRNVPTLRQTTTKCAMPVGVRITMTAGNAVSSRRR